MFTVLLLICLCKSKFENDAGYCLVVAYKNPPNLYTECQVLLLQVKKQLAVVFPSWNLEPFACDSQTLRTGEGWKVSNRLRFTFNKETEVESSLWSSLIG